MDILFALIIIAIGAFSILGATLKWSFFVEHRKARFMKKILGETGMRIFYIILGGFICLAGIFMAAGVWEIN